VEKENHVSVREIIETKLARKIAEKPHLSKDIGALYQFIITGKEGGEWILDFRGGSFKLSQGHCQNPDCIFTSSDQNLIDLFTGKINPALAFLTGQIRFTDLYYASKLKPLFVD
jgi:putative sterol carrier protein